jgi:hypothetical protein
MPVPAGQIAVLEADSSGQASQAPELVNIDPQDLPGFIREQIQADETLRNRIGEALNDTFRAGGDWVWNSRITLVAQSASKLYDGAPLTRSGDVLAVGLPAGFTVHASAKGSQTDAGIGENRVSSYSIFNAFGEDVTSHFTNIETISGKLIVDPAPLTVWTGSAEKVYDGTPLTSPEAGLSHSSDDKNDAPRWRNTAFVSDGPFGAQTLFALCGSVWVHGTSPLTGETQEIQLNAGEKMSVFLTSDGAIDLRKENVSEDEVPDDMLHLYADNPELFAPACADAGWDPEAFSARISQLAQEDSLFE